MIKDAILGLMSRLSSGTGQPSPPVMKKRLGITHQSYQYRSIAFDADRETAWKFNNYGDLVLVNFKTGSYSLSVDGRYDFQEVLDYIRSFESHPVVAPRGVDTELGMVKKDGGM